MAQTSQFATHNHQDKLAKRRKSSLAYDPALLDLFNFYGENRPRRPSIGGTLSVAGVDLIPTSFMPNGAIIDNEQLYAMLSCTLSTADSPAIQPSENASDRERYHSIFQSRTPATTISSTSPAGHENTLMLSAHTTKRSDNTSNAESLPNASNNRPDPHLRNQLMAPHRAASTSLKCCNMNFASVAELIAHYEAAHVENYLGMILQNNMISTQHPVLPVASLSTPPSLTTNTRPHMAVQPFHEQTSYESVAPKTNVSVSITDAALSVLNASAPTPMAVDPKPSNNQNHVHEKVVHGDMTSLQLLDSLMTDIFSTDPIPCSESASSVSHPKRDLTSDQHMPTTTPPPTSEQPYKRLRAISRSSTPTVTEPHQLSLNIIVNEHDVDSTSNHFMHTHPSPNDSSTQSTNSYAFFAPETLVIKQPTTSSLVQNFLSFNSMPRPNASHKNLPPPHPLNMFPSTSNGHVQPFVSVSSDSIPTPSSATWAPNFIPYHQPSTRMRMVALPASQHANETPAHTNGASVTSEGSRISRQDPSYIPVVHHAYVDHSDTNTSPRALSTSNRMAMAYPMYYVYPDSYHHVPTENVPTSYAPYTIDSNAIDVTFPHTDEYLPHAGIPPAFQFHPFSAAPHDAPMNSPPDRPFAHQASTSSTTLVSESTKRTYACPKKNCTKVYKNHNGLKYHLEHGNCEQDVSVSSTSSKTSPSSMVSSSIPLLIAATQKLCQEQPPTPPNTVPYTFACSAAPPQLTLAPQQQFIPALASDPNVKIANLPYWCRICGRRYKNLNGVKYHARVQHPEFDFQTQVKGFSPQISSRSVIQVE